MHQKAPPVRIELQEARLIRLGGFEYGDYGDLLVVR